MFPQAGHGFLWDKVAVVDGRAETTVFVPDSKKIFHVSIDVDDVAERDLTPTEWIEWKDVGERDAARPIPLIGVALLAAGKERSINTEYIDYTTFQSVLLFPDRPDLVSYVGENNAWSPIVGGVACGDVGDVEISRGVYCVGYVERDTTKTASAFVVNTETLKFPEKYRSDKDKRIFEGLAKEIELAIEEARAMASKGRTPGDTDQVIPVIKKKINHDDAAGFARYGESSNVIRCGIEQPGWSKFKSKDAIADIKMMAAMVKERRYHDVLVYKSRQENRKQMFVGWTPCIGSVSIFADSDKEYGEKVAIGQNLNTRIEFNKRIQKFAVDVVTRIEKTPVVEFEVRKNEKKKREEILLKIPHLKLDDFQLLDQEFRGKRVGVIDHPQFYKILVFEKDMLKYKEGSEDKKEEFVTAIVLHYENIENDTPGKIRLVVEKIADQFDASPRAGGAANLNYAAPDELEDDGLEDYNDDDDDDEDDEGLPEKDDGFTLQMQTLPTSAFVSNHNHGFSSIDSAPAQGFSSSGSAPQFRGGYDGVSRGKGRGFNGGGRGGERNDYEDGQRERGGGASRGRGDYEGGQRGGRDDGRGGGTGAWGEQGEGFGQGAWGGGGGSGGWGEQPRLSPRAPAPSDDWPEESHGFGSNSNPVKKVTSVTDKGILVSYSTTFSIFYTRAHNLVAFTGDAKLYNVLLGESVEFVKEPNTRGERLPFRVSPGSLKRIDPIFTLKMSRRKNDEGKVELHVHDQGILTPHRDTLECKQISDIELDTPALRLINDDFIDKYRLKIGHYYDVWIKFDADQYRWEFVCIDHTTSTFQIDEEDEIATIKRQNKERDEYRGDQRSYDEERDEYHDRDSMDRHYRDHRDEDIDRRASPRREEEYRETSSRGRDSRSSAPSRRLYQAPSSVAASTTSIATTVTKEMNKACKELDRTKKMLKAVWEYKPVQKSIKHQNFFLYEHVDTMMMDDAEEENKRSASRYTTEKEVRKASNDVKRMLKEMWKLEDVQKTVKENNYLYESWHDFIKDLEDDESERYD